MNSLSELIQKQRDFFQTGKSRSCKFRRENLKLLREVIIKNESLLYEALRADLNKSTHESYSTEIGPTLSELRFILRHLKEWMKPTDVPGMIFSFPSSGKILYEPYGTVLIISPWNYPVWLSLVPMIGAVCAGNCIILKPSEISTHTSSALKKIFDEIFPSEFIAVVEGAAEVSRQLMDLPPDYVFFTGSTTVGKIVAQSVAKNLIPYTLELGGKSPCIIDESADIKLSVKRMIWGKMITAGQTCVAPDYLIVHEKIKDTVVNEISAVLNKFYPEGALNDSDYPCIINEKNYLRLKSLMQGGKILLGGKTNDSLRKIEPTILGDLTWSDPAMNEEIFGPLLPVVTFKSATEVIETIKRHPNPLAFYIFSNDKKFRQKLLNELSFGGALINDTIEHLGNHYLPFGGIRSSGLGAYHGKFSFETFSHRKAVLKKGTWIDMNFRYKPYNGMKEWVMRTFLR